MASIHISKPGKFKSAEGVDIEITPEILSEVAQTYSPEKFEAQLVLGHPRMDAPSFGGIRSLSFGADGLEAVTEPTDDARELVSQRHFKSVSASFYTPAAPNNPTPGRWHLRHVGLLGATAPAVKGLRALSFAQTEEGVLTFGELPGYAGSSIARMFSSLRDWLLAEKGQDVADRVIPSWDIESLRSMSQRAEETTDQDDLSTIQGGTPALSFAESGKAATSSNLEKTTMKTAEQLQTELDASNAELKTLREAETRRITDTRHAAHVSFAETLVAAAKWPAGAKDVLVAVQDHVAAPVSTGVVSFGEGDSAKPLIEVLQEQLQALPPSVSFGEHARGGSSEDSSPAGLAAKALDYQKTEATKGNVVNTAQAVAHVSAA